MMTSKPYRYAAAIGRYCPIHLGHQRVLEEMRTLSEEHLVFLGSANAPWSLPLFFSYEERRTFLRVLFPDQRIIALPDFETDALWLAAIEDALHAAGMTPKEVVFFGGCDEDVLLLSEKGGYRTHVVNRFDGSSPVVSATEVRDALLHGRDIAAMVDPVISPKVIELFTKKWPEFAKKR